MLLLLQLRGLDLAVAATDTTKQLSLIGFNEVSCRKGERKVNQRETEGHKYGVEGKKSNFKELVHSDSL